LALAASCACFTVAAQAADAYPSKPITMVVPYPPGGPTDIVARLVAAEMSKTIGQNIVVDNKPGASGMIGADLVARAAPDGYTFLANASLHVINPYIYASMRYDAFKDFAPITQLADVPLVLVVPETSKVRTVQDLVAQGKAQPLNFGSAGSASAQQLAGESFKVRSGLPGYESTFWFGLFVPAGTPQAIVQRLHAAATKGLAKPEVKEKIALQGMDATPSASPEAFDADIRAEAPILEKAIRDSGAKIE
jgi:tripartite-type tricarboxylate transporter receptor subunit TctC